MDLETQVKKFRQEHKVEVSGDSKIDTTPLFDWSKGNFPKFVTSYLEKSKFVAPTPIQSQTLPISLTGRDIIAIAETGSGKTLAFLIPALINILGQSPLKKGDGPIAVVLAPTRELALQIEVECNKIITGTKLKCACIYGGASKGPQEKALKNGCEIVIATPGRLLDFLGEGVTNLDRVSFLVLDEADRMLDLGFKPQIEKIIIGIPKKRHTMMFSATWGKLVEEIAKNYIKNAVKVQIGHKDLTANKKVMQNFVKWTDAPSKMKILVDILTGKKDQKILIFVTRKKDATKLAKHLNEDNKFRALELHGNKSQNQREDAMKKYVSNQVNILVATDVASRGLDVKDIETVINFDLPTGGEAIETYVHRIGRTSRTGGLEGESITFVGPNEDLSFLDSLENVLKTANLPISQVIKDYTEMSFKEKQSLVNSQKKERSEKGKIIEQRKQERRQAKRQGFKVKYDDQDKKIVTKVEPRFKKSVKTELVKNVVKDVVKNNTPHQQGSRQTGQTFKKPTSDSVKFTQNRVSKPVDKPLNPTRIVEFIPSKPIQTKSEDVSKNVKSVEKPKTQNQGDRNKTQPKVSVEGGSVSKPRDNAPKQQVQKIQGQSQQSAPKEVKKTTEKVVKQGQKDVVGQSTK